MSAVDELRTMLDSEFFPDEIDSSAWIVEHGDKILALLEAARPFGEMAQEMLTGHPTGRLSPGVPEHLLAALAAFDTTPEPGKAEATTS